MTKLTKTNPNNNLFPVSSRLLDLANDPFFSGLFWSGIGSSDYPVNSNLSYRVSSGEDSATIEVDVPGVEPKDIEIEIEGRSLTVKTPRGNAFVTTGLRLDTDRAEATVKLGQLIITVPKREAKVTKVKITEID